MSNVTIYYKDRVAEFKIVKGDDKDFSMAELDPESRILVLQSNFSVYWRENVTVIFSEPKAMPVWIHATISEFKKAMFE